MHIYTYTQIQRPVYEKSILLGDFKNKIKNVNSGNLDGEFTHIHDKTLPTELYV